LAFEDAEDFGKWVAARRSLLGISQTALANSLGITQPNVSEIEAGIRPTSKTTRQKIRAALAMRPADAVSIRASSVRDLFGQYTQCPPAVFGSTARSEDNSDSDIDIIADFPAGFNLFDKADLVIGLQELLTFPVDIVKANSRIIDEAQRQFIETAKNEAVLV